MSCSGPKSVSGGRFVGAASIVRVVAAAVVQFIVSLASKVGFLIPKLASGLGKVFEPAIVRAAAVVALSYPIKSAVVAVYEAGTYGGSESVLTLSSAGVAVLSLLVFALVVARSVGTAGSVREAVGKLFQGRKGGVRGAAAVAAAVVRPSSVFPVARPSSVAGLPRWEARGFRGCFPSGEEEETAPPAPFEQDKPIHHDTDEKKKKKKKRVTFGVVRVQEYAAVLGTGNTLAPLAYPIALDWAHSKEKVFTLDALEAKKLLPIRRSRFPVVRHIPAEERIERICEVGDVDPSALELAEWERIQTEKQHEYELAQKTDVEEEEEVGIEDMDWELTDDMDWELTDDMDWEASPDDDEVVAKVEVEEEERVVATVEDEEEEGVVATVEVEEEEGVVATVEDEEEERVVATVEVEEEEGVVATVEVEEEQEEEVVAAPKAEEEEEREWVTLPDDDDEEEEQEATVAPVDDEEDEEVEEHEPQEEVEGTEPTVEAPLPQQKQKKRVTFGSVLVREHKVILGTGNTLGPTIFPLALDWAHTEDKEHDLDWWDEGQAKGTCRYLEADERLKRVLDVADAAEAAALEWKEECRIQREKQQSLLQDLGELLEKDEEEDEATDKGTKPRAARRSAKKRPTCPTQPLRRSARLANKPRINYKE